MGMFPSDSEARQAIVETGRRMYMKNFVAANDGNISCKVGEDVIWVTPTGVSKGFMSGDDLVKMRLDGTVITPGSAAPSSEIKMHLRVYKENPEIMGITHAHPPAATAFAVAGLPLDKMIYPEAIVNLGVVPCVSYATPGSSGVAEAVAPYCRDYNALLLANHGALTWGRSVMEAYFRMESLEHYASILINIGRIGGARELSGEQAEELIKIRDKMK